MKTWGVGYEKSKKKAKEMYSKIGRVKCPALDNEDISFSRIGFNHLIRKGRIPRPRNEQKRRFVLLPYVEEIIKNSEAKILYRHKRIKYKANRHGEKILIESEANFWIFAQKIKSCAIKVIIRQLNNGNKHFLSEWAIALKLIIKIKETKNPPKNRRFFVVSAISLNADRD